MTGDLPRHLRRYVVDQDYSRYTPIDQAVWRHIMRQLKSFLSVHAHPCYVDGLKKTGIEIERIPVIEEMSRKLELFGWRAVPVSGFIPPAAFMELQSLGVLPIACDMRSLDHLLYTPAPDIVHEAAGHAPILVDPAFASYLKAYAQVASKAIIGKQDMDQYEVIRILSDLKEAPDSTAAQIAAAEAKLANISAAITEQSEAALLGRMNWWTAEYGLIGDLERPKIFGAGLLSSVGESRDCLDAKVKKLPLTIECVRYAYDITEQQPQLFVVRKFDDLTDVLSEFAKTMAFRRGGLESLQKVQRAETVNTVELDSSVQLSGVLSRVLTSKVDGNEVPAYLNFSGPVQLSVGGFEVPGQGVKQHPSGFGTPIGRATIAAKGQRPTALIELSRLSDSDLARLGIRQGSELELRFETGVVVTGRLTSHRRTPKGRLIILSLEGAKAQKGAELLFDPAWGAYDLALGTTVVSCFGGPSDRSRYGDTEDFKRALIPRRSYSAAELKRHALYQRARDLRGGDQTTTSEFETLIGEAKTAGLEDWLLWIELQELEENHGAGENARAHLDKLIADNPAARLHVEDARKTLHLDS